MDTIPQYTFAGDYTVEAIEKASQEVAKFDAGMRSATRGADGRIDARPLDDWFVITVTDANFGRYNITPEYITRTMAKFPRVNNAVVCLGDGLEVAQYVPFSTSDRRLLLKALQAYTEVSKNVLPGAEYCGYSERAEEHPLKYGREMKDRPTCKIHLSMVPNSFHWILSLGESEHRVRKVCPSLQPRNGWHIGSHNGPRIGPYIGSYIVLHISSDIGSHVGSSQKVSGGKEEGCD